LVGNGFGHRSEIRLQIGHSATLYDTKPALPIDAAACGGAAGA